MRLKHVRSASLAFSLLLLTFVPATAAEFPTDSGILNVRDFGAKGDGTHDDTAALTAAIAAEGGDTGSFFWRTRIVFFPAGTYLVSGTLAKRYADGRFASGMVLIGQSTAGTIIKLVDHARGFDNANAPHGVIMTTSKLLDGTPTSGGKDYTHKGEGNDAYENCIEDLTVDIGAGNPGAIGIDYLANNIGDIRDVRVTAPDGSGAVGISMQRKWPGPALLQNIEIDGFDAGIAVSNTEYGVTLDHVTLRGQRHVGLQNDGNSVATANLDVDADGTAIANLSPGGLIVLADAVLRRHSEAATALLNHGAVVARNVTLDGFDAPPDSHGSLIGVWQGEQWQPKQAPIDPPLQNAPAVPMEPPSRWVNVAHYIAPSDRHDDITGALQRAMATGAATIYLPFGRYVITDGVEIPPTVQHIAGMNSSITVTPERLPTFARTSGMFRISQPGPPLLIDRLAFDMTNLGDQLAVQATAHRDVTLRDTVTGGTSLLDRNAAGGRIFLEDVCCGGFRIAGPEPVYARQFDGEGDVTRIVNDGSPLVVLGIKTEGNFTVLDNRNGARTQILGGLLYVVQDANPPVPAFVNSHSTLLASFLEESFRSASRYAVYLQDRDTSLVVRPSSFPARGYGRIVPWLMSAAGQ